MKIMTSIVLINPPSPFLIDDMVFPPLGIMYLSSYLKSKGIDTTIHDLAGLANSSIPYAKYTAFTATTPQYPYALKAMKENKNNNSETINIIGGAHVSSFLSSQQDGWDVSVVGEGELALYQIIRSEKISNSVIIGNQIENLDSLPFPDREWDGFERYHYKFNDIDFTTAMTSRGCSYRCSFCFNMFGTKIRFMSPNRVIEEAKIINGLGFDGIMYYDDTFTVNKQRVVKIAEGLKDIGMKYRCFVRANTVNNELLLKLKNTGCVEIGMGVESGSQKILDTINKQITVEQCEKVIEYCHKIGLSIKIFLMVGLPGESHDTVQDTIKFLRKNKPDNYDIAIFTPFPGTDIWTNKDKSGYDINFDKNSINYNKMFYKGIAGNYTSQVSTSNMTSEDIEHLRDYIDIDVRNEITYICH